MSQHRGNDLASTDSDTNQDSSNPPKQPAKPNADEVLHEFALGIAKNTWTQGAYERRYHKANTAAKHQMASDLIGMLPKKPKADLLKQLKKPDPMNYEKDAEQRGFIKGIDQATEAIRAYFGVNGEGR